MNTQSNNAPFTNNTLLAALPENELSLLWPHLQHVSIVLHQVLHEPGNRIEDIYFVESGLVSITANTGDRSQVEVGLVGRDGMVGEVLLIDPQAMVVNRALVQAPGTALRIRADILLGLLDQCPTLTRMGRLGLHYTLLQATQTAACNARHETPQRLARWLLMAQDRLDSDELPHDAGVPVLLPGRAAGRGVGRCRRPEGTWRHSPVPRQDHHHRPRLARA